MDRRREVKTNGTPGGLRDDRELWQHAVRDVQPLRGRSAPIPAEPSRVPPSGSDRAEEPGAGPSSTSAPLDRFAGIDRANAERLKRGRYKIEASLDLHGMNQAEAHRALTAFVGDSRDAGWRCLLIITGRGFGPSGPGVLKSSVPRWLEEPELRRQILATAPAQPRHGGAGAIYLLLRRRR
jgi:DNA-nicking Smr family endonuclease